MAVVSIPTLPKFTPGGFADAAVTPVPESGTGIPMQEPPATGHSKTFSVSLAAPAVVGSKLSLIVQVPGPVKPPPAPQASKSNEKGGLRPPEATDAL